MHWIKSILCTISWTSFFFFIHCCSILQNCLTRWIRCLVILNRVNWLDLNSNRSEKKKTPYGSIGVWVSETGNTSLSATHKQCTENMKTMCCTWFPIPYTRLDLKHKGGKQFLPGWGSRFLSFNSFSPPTSYMLRYIVFFCVFFCGLV